MEGGIFFFWIIFAVVVGVLGKDRRIGGGMAFLASIFLSPLIGLIITLASEKIDPRANATTPQAHKLFADGERKIRNKEYDGAIQSLEGVLDIQPFAPMTHYYLATLYSVKENKDKAFKHLALAVEQGFKDFRAMNSTARLDFLRRQPEFRDFALNGYKFSQTKSSDDVITKLERLGKLKSEGLITEEEFAEQKSKLLTS